MAKKRGKTPVFDYLEKIEQHFPYLMEVKKIDSLTRKAFFKQFLGTSETSCNNWWKFGIRRIYFAVLFLLDEVKAHKERVKILEKQLNELTKK